MESFDSGNSGVDSSVEVSDSLGLKISKFGLVVGNLGSVFGAVFIITVLKVELESAKISSMKIIEVAFEWSKTLVQFGSDGVSGV